MWPMLALITAISLVLFQVQSKCDLPPGRLVLLSWMLQFHLDCVQYYASSENVSLLPLVVRLSSIKSMS